MRGSPSARCTECGAFAAISFHWGAVGVHLHKAGSGWLQILGFAALVAALHNGGLTAICLYRAVADLMFGFQFTRGLEALLCALWFGGAAAVSLIVALDLLESRIAETTSRARMPRPLTWGLGCLSVASVFLWPVIAALLQDLA